MKAIIFFQLACLTTAYRWLAEAFNMIWRGRTAAGAQQLKRPVSSALTVFPAGIFDKIWGKDSGIRPSGQKATNYFGLSFFKGLGLLGNVSEIIAVPPHSPSQAVQPTIEEVQDFIASLHAAKSPPTAPQSKAPPNVGKVNRNCNLIVGYEDLPVFRARTSNNVKVSPRPRPSAGRPRRLLSSPRTIDNMLAD